MAAVLWIGSPERAQALESAGHRVTSGKASLALLKSLETAPPAVVAIDLSRAPATGRDIALAIRKRKATRHLPFVFVDGDPTAVRALLPHETYCRWDEAGRAIKKTAASKRVPTEAPSVMAGYAATPVAKKLGIEPGITVALIGEPPGFRESMPEGVRWHDRPNRQTALTIWFVRTPAELEAELEWIAAASTRLWIAWPKGGKAPALTQPSIRAAANAAGMVDYKICSIDATWSALLFTWR